MKWDDSQNYYAFEDPDLRWKSLKQLGASLSRGTSQAAQARLCLSPITPRLIQSTSYYWDKGFRLNLSHFKSLELCTVKYRFRVSFSKE
eukprot:g10250.t1